MEQKRSKNLQLALEYGAIAEKHIATLMKNSGKEHMPYIPLEGAEPGDIFYPYLFKFVELKTKAKRIWYPDTGFNLSQWKTYEKRWHSNYNIDTLFIFVDTSDDEIYGNYLSELLIEKVKVLSGKNNQEILRKYPYTDKPNAPDGTRQIYFHLDSMKNEMWIAKELNIKDWQVTGLKKAELFKTLKEHGGI